MRRRIASPAAARVSGRRRDGRRGRRWQVHLPPRVRAPGGHRPRLEAVRAVIAVAGVLGEWVDVDNQLAPMASALAVAGVWLRFKRDSGMPPRLGVVNPATRPQFTIRGEVTAVPNPDGAGWVFRYHDDAGGLPLPLGADVLAAASRVAHLLGVCAADRAEDERPAGERRGARKASASSRYEDT